MSFMSYARTRRLKRPSVSRLHLVAEAGRMKVVASRCVYDAVNYQDADVLCPQYG